MNKPIVLTTLVVSLLASTNSIASEWSYSGDTGPTKWAQLSNEFSTCDSGKNQSPIDLSSMTEAKLAPLVMEYKNGGKEVIYNGHTVQVNYEKGSYLKLDDKSFELKQFHFHTPSENNIKGESFPMEVHLVHSSAKGELAVVAVMFEMGDENPALAGPWSKLPLNKGETALLDPKFNAKSLVPISQEYYRFNGSLTTPPCSEGVRWVVMKSMSEVSQPQVKLFLETLKHTNNRPIQATNARLIVK